MVRAQSQKTIKYHRSMIQEKYFALIAIQSPLHHRVNGIQIELIGFFASFFGRMGFAGSRPGSPNVDLSTGLVQIETVLQSQECDQNINSGGVA